MAKRANGSIGIDLSIDSIRVVTLEQQKTLRVSQRQAATLSPNTFADEREIDWQVIEQSLADVLAKANIRKGRAHVAIPNQYAVIRELSLPDFSDEELRSLIQFELTNSIHVPFQEVVFDFVRVPKKDDGAENPGEVNVILVAADKQLCERLVKLLQKFRIRTTSIELRSLAAHRVLKRVRTLPEAVLLVETNATGTSIHVFHRDVLYLTRHVNMYLMDGEISDGTAVANFNVGSDPMVDLVSSALEMGATPLDTNVERLSAEAYVTRIGAELDRTRNFFHYTLNRRQAEFGEVIFVGGRNLPSDAMANLQTLLGMRVVSLAFQDMIDAGLFKERRGASLLGDEGADDYAVAIGLALREV